MPAAVTVRPAVAADVPALAEVAALTFPLACPPHTTLQAQQAFIAEVLSAARFADYLRDDSRAVLVAEVDGAILGYTMLVFGPPTDPDVVAAVRITSTVELSKCYVLPHAHGSGVAGELMEASLALARARDAAGIWLGVNQLNQRAHRFYGKHGFARVGTKHFHVGEGVEDDFVLERPL